MGSWFVYIVFVPVILLLAGLGCALRYGKAYWLISGYNTMPEEKKKNVDARGLGRFLGLCLIIGAAAAAAALGFFAIGVNWAGIALLAPLLPGLVFMFVRAQRFDGNAVRPDGRMTAQAKVTVALLIVVLGGIAGAVIALLNDSANPVRYNLTAEALEIKCTFGETVKLADIESLALTQERPAVASRTFGSALGEKLRGSFSLEGGGSARVFVETASPPFIAFTSGDLRYFLNCGTAEETEALFDKLNNALDH